jgi:hypothetical protein
MPIRKWVLNKISAVVWEIPGDCFHMDAVLWHQITTARTAGAGSDDSKKAELWEIYNYLNMQSYGIKLRLHERPVQVVTIARKLNYERYILLPELRRFFPFPFFEKF